MSILRGDGAPVIPVPAMFPRAVPWSLLLLLGACDGAGEGAPTAPVPAPVAAGPASPGPASPGGPVGPPPPGAPPPGGSGAAMQDPTGFPPFHDLPAPPGPPPGPAGGFSAPVALAARPAGGFRPQVAVGPDGALHAVYYDRVPAGDVVRYRRSADGRDWSPPETVSPEQGRNWGPDIAIGADGTVVVAYDHAEADLRSRGWVRERGPSGWGTAVPVTPAGARESGSGHVAIAGDGRLAYVYIGKELGPEHRFRAWWTWGRGDRWSEPVAFSDGREDAWHTNVEARPDGSVLAFYDTGPGGSETVLWEAEGRDGRFGAPQAPDGPRGERVNPAFHAGVDWITWFHKVGGLPIRVYVRSGRPGAWGPVDEPSAGLGGFHFDPDVAVAPDGTVCVVWGWDGGGDAELVYALRRDGAWTAPRKVAELDWGKPGLPSIEAGPDGRFHVVWTQGVRGSNEVWYAVLPAGG